MTPGRRLPAFVGPAWIAGVVVWSVVLGPGAPPAGALLPEPDVLDADDPTITEDLGFTELDLTGTIDVDEDVVLAAQKIRRTVQEAPSIITVITREQMNARGYRTLNDALRSVPGFEGDRWEGNGWHKEAFARGLPRTVLVLINGVSVIEPVRNFINLDRKIPLETVDRIEVTSGPGGVLWGSNALLGIVNIVTRRPEGRGVHGLAGFGDGPGDRLHFKGAVGIDQEITDDIALFAHFSVFSTDGAEVTVDAQKIAGALTAPSPDSATVYLPGKRTATPGKRSWFFDFTGRLELGPFALDWMIPFEEEYRPLATGGGVMVHDYLTGRDDRPATRGQDAVRLGNLSYRDRFLDGDFGVHGRLFFVQWEIREAPFGVFPASSVIFASQKIQTDLHVAMEADLVARTGVALDVDYRITEDLVLLAGGELLFEMTKGLRQQSWTVDTLGTCPEGFTYDAFDPYLACHVNDPLVGNTSRLIGALFAQVDWRILPMLAVNAGLRLQLSDTYDPAFLYSGGLVWNIWDRINVKLFASSGMRPPSFTATHVRDTTSGISFNANPDLKVETSTSVEMEANAMLLRDLGPVRDLYLRANGAWTFMDNVIGRPAGQFQNSNERQIWSAEAMARLRFDGGHVVWGNYSFTKVLDAGVPGGEIRNFAEHMGNVGATVSFLDEHIELNAVLNIKGAMKDANRPAIVDPNGVYSTSCADLAASPPPADDWRASVAGTCALPGMQDAVIVAPGQNVTETIRPLALLDLGVRFKNLWRDLTASVFVYNVFDHRYYEPDYFQDPRVLSRPQPKPGFSVYGQVSIGL